ncbi:glycine/betaine ABC transporter substrate-binding protein [Desulfobacter hydrogenophilus]|uniref:ABC transporter substrate-binding protein n=1 Tax=Desulfobacter hydrogenophilus TaxID=2291 RepID=A0A328FG83_9BACT|nr:ABC transporter substrate-binding protein [Desulfobacter hydrogenophilus]NDY70575.1 ABC transporter substrate-binding protein [Desulfobacter hydrogenophilus]QBH13946.1 ABC transporter substrate-binding protein [Desulfobacter hydrogenophilus]RAM03641.1 glycine/betaine ABC transporter substrate-binding protein [Desulfobacter hydrogenophilus]
MLRKTSRIIITVFIAAVLTWGTAFADKSPKIKIASVGWTGVTIKTELAVAVLDSIGYDAQNLTMSVPITYMALSKGDVDFFLGNWMPTMANIANKYFENGSVIQYTANMPGAKYTLAVPSFCMAQGLKDFKDIVKFGDELDWRIYGIEAGNDGNQVIQSMIDKNMFGLGKFKLVASSEMAMLAQVQSFAQQNKPIVFLGWAPHSMNERIDMSYLTGSTSETFGGDDGTATVWTNTRKGFDKDMPNVATFLKNFTFPIAMINQIMTSLHTQKGLSPRDAGLLWLKQHPDTYRGWLKNVTATDGKPAAPVFAIALENVGE